MASEIQKKLLEMFEWFHKYTKENSLRYYIVGGTLLGAVRHQGFIPWDDDIDVAMPREDYNKLAKLLSVKNDKYIMESPNYCSNDYYYAYAKLYDTSTTVTEYCNGYITRGIYIDIFPLDGIGNTIEKAKNNYRYIDILYKLLMTKTCLIRKERKWYKNFAIRIAKFIPNKLLNVKALINKINDLCSKHSFDDSNYVGNLLSTYGFKDVVQKSVYGTPKLYSFDGIKVYGVEDYEKFLTNVYGNWRELPPIEKRISLHDFFEFDLNKSYLIDKE